MQTMTIGRRGMRTDRARTAHRAGPSDLRQTQSKARRARGYIVNAVSRCNALLLARVRRPSLPAATTPSSGQPEQVNPATYSAAAGTSVRSARRRHQKSLSRNLTPDKSGLPEGGATFAEFYESIRHGIDHDHVHPELQRDRHHDAAFLTDLPPPAVQRRSAAGDLPLARLSETGPTAICWLSTVSEGDSLRAERE